MIRPYRDYKFAYWNNKTISAAWITNVFVTAQTIVVKVSYGLVQIAVTTGTPITCHAAC